MYQLQFALCFNMPFRIVYFTLKCYCIYMLHMIFFSTEYHRIAANSQVVLLVLEVHAGIARDVQHFRHLVVFLIHSFHSDHMLLEKYGI